MKDIINEKLHQKSLNEIENVKSLGKISKEDVTIFGAIRLEFFSAICYRHGCTKLCFTGSP
jgi:hypothetical protein